MRDLTKMAMRPINLPKVNKDIVYGQPVMIATTPDQDVQEDKDYIIEGFGIAMRRRRLLVTKYKQVSIRYSRRSGNPTECQKIVAGHTKALLYVFEFKDCYVIARMVDIKDLLLKEQYVVVDNHDAEGTKACYLNIKDLPHLFIPKQKV